MNPSDNAAEQPQSSPALSPSLLWRTISPAMLLVSGTASVIGMAVVLPLFITHSSSPLLRMSLGAASLWLGATITFRHRRQWVTASLRMRQLLSEVRLGQAPIDEFSKCRFGSLGELGQEITLLLQDFRQQRQAIAELNDELRQRVAQRTSALERTVASLRNQASRDPLTGLYNRRMLDQLLPQLVSQCQTERKTLTLIMIDLDYFKSLNDTLGHAAGDEMLKGVGQIIHSTIRDGDFGCRYGGDEFVVLLPGCEAAVAAKVCDRLQSLVLSLGKAYKVPQTPRLSIGMATLAELKNPDGIELLKKADARLYETKAARKTASAA